MYISQLIDIGNNPDHIFLLPIITGFRLTMIFFILIAGSRMIFYIFTPNIIEIDEVEIIDYTPKKADSKNADFGRFSIFSKSIDSLQE